MLREILCMKRFITSMGVCLLLLFTAGCETNQMIINDVQEKEANEILVFLASNTIEAQKVAAATSGVGANNTNSRYAITVSSKFAVEAMSLLNQVGLPRKQGTTLLELFAKQGLMSSSMEETIRYQAGVAEELKNTIRKIDGILDADVQISYPPANTQQLPGQETPKITAAVYIKHQGLLEEPNSHMETKIKRLLAGSVSGLSYDSVSVISDRARFADIALGKEAEAIGAKALQTHVSIWGLVITKSSLSHFRMLFFTLLVLLLASLGCIGWMGFLLFPKLQGPFKKTKE